MIVTTLREFVGREDGAINKHRRSSLASREERGCSNVPGIQNALWLLICRTATTVVPLCSYLKLSVLNRQKMTNDQLDVTLPNASSVRERTW